MHHCKPLFFFFSLESSFPNHFIVYLPHLAVVLNKPFEALLVDFVLFIMAVAIGLNGLKIVVLLKLPCVIIIFWLCVSVDSDNDNLKGICSFICKALCLLLFFEFSLNAFGSILCIFWGVSVFDCEVMSKFI